MNVRRQRTYRKNYKRTYKTRTRNKKGDYSYFGKTMQDKYVATVFVYALNLATEPPTKGYSFSTTGLSLDLDITSYAIDNPNLYSALSSHVFYKLCGIALKVKRNFVNANSWDMLPPIYFDVMPYPMGAAGKMDLNFIGYDANSKPYQVVSTEADAYSKYYHFSGSYQGKSGYGIWGNKLWMPCAEFATESKRFTLNIGWVEPPNAVADTRLPLVSSICEVEIVLYMKFCKTVNWGKIQLNNGMKMLNTQTKPRQNEEEASETRSLRCGMEDVSVDQEPYKVPVKKQRLEYYDKRYYKK